VVEVLRELRMELLKEREEEEVGGEAVGAGEARSRTPCNRPKATRAARRLHSNTYVQRCAGNATGPISYGFPAGVVDKFIHPGAVLFVVPAYYADGCDAPWRVQQCKAKKRTRVKLWDSWSHLPCIRFF
jgi:hypothetical protein